MKNLVELSHITKSFGGSRALDDVSLELFPGSVHALMGENGAGKSTLMKVLAGVHRPDSGQVFKNGHAVSFANPREALGFGISTVFQEMNLLANLTIAENMFLGREPTTALGRIDYKRMHAETRKALDDVNLKLDPETLVSELSIADRQFVEIAHGIKADAGIFILDEPTAALNAADVEVLNGHIRRLRDAGKAIVYISHRMNEIFEICDTVTVLKDGKLVGTKPLAEMTPSSLINMMVGRDLQEFFPSRGSSPGDMILDIKHLKLTATDKPLSLHVRRGEIVALAGLEGQGQQEIIRSLIGQHQPFSGTVTLNGKLLPLPVNAANGVRQLQAAGVGFVPEDRKDDGLLLGLSIAHNIAIALYAARNALAPAPGHRATVEQTMLSMNIKGTPSTAVGTLSGGNQQKVLLGRYLAAKMNLLLVEEPTRGVDVGAKSEIYKLLREFTNGGGGVLVLSRETVELIGLCDRIHVVHRNTLVAEMPAAEATEKRILEAALTAEAGEKS